MVFSFIKIRLFYWFDLLFPFFWWRINIFAAQNYHSFPKSCPKYKSISWIHLARRGDVERGGHVWSPWTPNLLLSIWIIKIFLSELTFQTTNKDILLGTKLRGEHLPILLKWIQYWTSLWWQFIIRVISDHQARDIGNCLSSHLSCVMMMWRAMWSLQDVCQVDQHRRYSATVTSQPW